MSLGFVLPGGEGRNFCNNIDPYVCICGVESEIFYLLDHVCIFSASFFNFLFFNPYLFFYPLLFGEITKARKP